MRGRRFTLATLALAAATAGAADAQIYQSDFPPEEFRARWARVFDRIGSEAVAVAQGAPLADGFALPRQSNTLYYLTGIETPHAYVVLDGRTRRVTIYLPPRNERLERSEGRVLSAEDDDEVKRLTGADEVRSTEEMRGGWPLGNPSDGRVRTVYAESAPAEGYAQSRYELVQSRAAIAADYWDGGLPRERRFIELLRARHPRVAIGDLTPILDDLRSIKSVREVALIRRASQLAGLGLIEAIRSSEAGVYEYQLEAAARYVFAVHGARLDGYRAIAASGTDNIWNGHYYRNSRRLEDGDLVLMDYAPDCRYYTSDIGRMWPVSGTYAPWQRELLQIVLDYHKIVLARIRPGVTADQVLEEARQAMAPILASRRFSKPIYEQAVRKMVETGGGALSHPVGLAVHDVGTYRNGPLKPGHVFSVDPQLWVPEETLYIRYEDTGVVTDTGFENFTAFVPTELDDLEALARERGIVQRLPATPAEGMSRSAGPR
jgi:Xaa-Pro aminopeptidase